MWKVAPKETIPNKMLSIISTISMVNDSSSCINGFCQTTNRDLKLSAITA